VLALAVLTLYGSGLMYFPTETSIAVLVLFPAAWVGCCFRFCYASKLRVPFWRVFRHRSYFRHHSKEPFQAPIILAIIILHILVYIIAIQSGGLDSSGIWSVALASDACVQYYHKFNIWSGISHVLLNYPSWALHGHLLGNVVFFIVIGVPLEYRVGSPAVLMTYLFLVFVSPALFSICYNTIGSSVIADGWGGCLLGLALVNFPLWLYNPHDEDTDIVRNSALLALLLDASAVSAINTAGWLASAAGQNISHVGHGVGFLLGLFFGMTCCAGFTCGLGIRTWPKRYWFYTMLGVACLTIFVSMGFISTMQRFPVSPQTQPLKGFPTMRR